MKKQTKYVLLVLVLVIVGLFSWNALPTAGSHDAFAECLEESGTIFYGAFWCPACKDQKALFGKSDRLLPYVECSPRSRQGLLPVCQEANIETFPTWEFKDGERETGVLSLSALAEKTGCSLSE